MRTREWLVRLAFNGPGPLQTKNVGGRVRTLKRVVRLSIALGLTGCGAADFNLPGANGNEALYSSIYPDYAEFCALSQINKKEGYGADIRGEMGGHSVLYLSGACRDPGTDYPVLQVCDPSTGRSGGGMSVDGAQPGGAPGGDAPGGDAHADRVQTAGDQAGVDQAGVDRAGVDQTDGVGITMNSHFSNAKWAAVPGRAFFFDGGLPRDHGLTRTDYVRAKERAKQLSLYRAVTFQPWVFDDKPDDVSREDWKYEISIATDYAISFGRGRYCARIPVTRAQTARMVAFLNGQNAPYREGKEVFEWSIFQDNCIHLAHNALTAAGVWQQWPIYMPLLFAIFDFPVPKNEFVNIMRRMNDPPDVDLLAIYHDETAAQSLAEFGRLPWVPGVVAEDRPPQEPNEVYDTDLALIFYDDPVTGRYQRRFDAIFADPRNLSVTQNLQYFAALYRRMEADRKPLDTWLARSEFRDPEERQRFTDFYRRFYAYLDHERIEIAANLKRLAVVASADRAPSPHAKAAAP